LQASSIFLGLHAEALRAFPVEVFGSDYVNGGQKNIVVHI